MVRPPPGSKAEQASQALARLAALGTRRPLLCSSEPSARCSGGLNRPAARDHRPSGSPRYTPPRALLAPSPRPGVRGRPPATVRGREPWQSRAGAGGHRTLGTCAGVVPAAAEQRTCAPGVTFGRLQVSSPVLAAAQPHGTAASQPLAPLPGPADTPGAARLERTSPPGAGSAPGLRSLPGPRERADHAARRFYVLPGRRPPRGPLLSPGA